MYNWDTNLDRAPADYDRKFVFVFSHVWELPLGPGKTFLGGHSLVDRVAGGWTISGIWTAETGSPFTPFLGNDASLNSDCCTLRPESWVIQMRRIRAERCGSIHGIRHAALVYLGNAGRNILRTPGYFEWTSP